jgi:arsenate reductase
MAEGIANYLGNGILKATSAGLNPAGFVHPLAIKVMEEIGIDISNYKSKQIDLNLLNETDIIITLCGDAYETCPITPQHIKKIHWGLPDPAKATGTEDEILNFFRKVRDDLKVRIENLIKEYKEGRI